MAFKLNPEPTFKASVRIPVPGGESEPVEFTFKHRTTTQIKSFFLEECKGSKSDVDVVKLMVVGWGLDDAFNDENLGRLIDNYPGSRRAITDAYFDELTKGRLGN